MLTRNMKRCTLPVDEIIRSAEACKQKRLKVEVKAIKQSTDAGVKKGKLKSKQIKVEKEEKSSYAFDNKTVIKEESLSERFVGAHISAAGGLQNGPINAAAIGANCFALFLKSQRTWNSKPLEDKTILAFKKQCRKLGFTSQHILPHGSYLLNCGSPKKDVLEKSRATLIDELQRCEKLGIQLYNFHPGSTCGEIEIEECLNRIGESINLAHSKTKSVITVVENMSCQGNTVGGKFEELKGIIDLVHDKSRIGICLDTCHAFAAGYDVSSPKKFDDVMQEFDRIIGIKYLKALHLNDSKGKLGCHLDRHENIGKGHIGNGCFEFIMNDPRFIGIPMILETPCEDDKIYEQEIRFLYSIEKHENGRKNMVK
ncbi:hypothetical protein CHUAL_002478 [Chamberlinius hualienensis]